MSLSHGSVAKKVRLQKERHPEWYCQSPACLWKIFMEDVAGNLVPLKPCRSHPALTSAGSFAILPAHPNTEQK